MDGTALELASASWIVPASICTCRPHYSEGSAKIVLCRAFFFHCPIIINLIYYI